MKKYFILLLGFSFFFSCGPSEKELELQAQLDSLQKVSGADSQTINEYMKAFNEIQTNLDEIKEKEKIISANTSGDIELSQTDKDRINEDVMSIYELMLDNKKKLSYLKNKLKKSNSKVGEFKKTISRLTEEMSQKEDQISELKSILETKDFDIVALNTKIEVMNDSLLNLDSLTLNQKEVLDKQDIELHTAYFVVGTKRELKDKGIISTEGGFIGIGGIQKIQQNSEEFQKIDIRERTEITLPSSSKALLLTDHPDGTYEFIKDGSDKIISVSVTDIKEFWEMSKYLVVIIK